MKKQIYFDDKEYTITSHPYQLDNGNFVANAIDSEGNDYLVTWKKLPPMDENEYESMLLTGDNIEAFDQNSPSSVEPR